jgi:uncharacterized metal-binding protein YceD (DUF177 family)
MVLPRGYFHIVYSTYARLDSPAVVDRVFEMFDKDRSGNFSFEGTSVQVSVHHVGSCCLRVEFVEFLGTVVKGGVEEKVEYFFRLYGTRLVLVCNACLHGCALTPFSSM